MEAAVADTVFETQLELAARHHFSAPLKARLYPKDYLFYLMHLYPIYGFLNILPKSLKLSLLQLYACPLLLCNYFLSNLSQTLKLLYFLSLHNNLDSLKGYC